MKMNLFLSVVSLFVTIHLCKAGPLRLHKRAVFYIANETACVVDNIVYSNGDPIPTEDPCEACKCRPPGFACVLKQCKTKPGCKAIRRIGECCPDYVCGCEHNGRMYKDGEEIRDPKNPCYECHCQGSSIACAFVDCFFRDNCETVYLPGECCPQYKNCTRDEINKFPTDNALPPVHLLPALNDESVLPGDFPSTSQKPEPTEKPTDPTPSNNDETPVPEVKEPVKTSSELQTTVSVPVSEANEHVKLDAEVESNNEDKTENDNEKEADIENDKTETLLNSETEIKKKDDDYPTTEDVDPTQPSVEKVEEEEPKTTVSNELVEDESEEGSESPENKVITTQIPETEKQVKNSAADNGKSLKLDEELKDPQKDEESKTDVPEEKSDETVTESQSESVSEMQPDISNESSAENKPKLEETQTNPQATSIHSSNEKIKSESAETVTIVVHVREKASTEKDLATEKVTMESEISTTQANLLKSNDELVIIKEPEESTKDDVASTDKNFEVFASSTELSTDKPTTDLPSTETGEKIEERSDEIELNSDAMENSPSEEKVSDLKNDEDSPLATTPQNTEDVSQEVTSSKEAEIETNEPTVTVSNIDPNAALKIKIISDSGTTILKINEETIKEPEIHEVEEAKSEEIPEKSVELKEEKNTEEINPEAREDEPTTEDKIEETTPAEKDVETASTQKSEEISLAEKTESTSTEKLEESPTEKIESTSTEKLETAPEEKIKESKSVDSIPETDKTEAQEIEHKETTQQTTTAEITKTENSKHNETTELTTPAEIAKAEKHRHDETTEQTTTAETTKVEKHKHDETTELKNQGTEK